MIYWLYLAESISLKSFTWSSPQHLGPLGPPEPPMYAAKVSLLQQVSSHGHTGRELLGFATSAIDLPIHQLYIMYMHVIYKYYYTYHGKKTVHCDSIQGCNYDYTYINAACFFSFSHVAFRWYLVNDLAPCRALGASSYAELLLKQQLGVSRLGCTSRSLEKTDMEQQLDAPGTPWRLSWCLMVKRNGHRVPSWNQNIPAVSKKSPNAVQRSKSSLWIVYQVTAKVSTCLNTDSSKQNVKPGDSTKTCLNSSKFYMKSMNNFNELQPLLHHSRECTKLLPAFLHQWASEYEWHCSMGPCDYSNVQDMVFVEDQIIHTFIQLPSDKKDRLKERVRQES